MTIRSESVEDYLKTIWSLGGGDGPVGTVDLARALAVSPASATGMVKRLAAEGLARHRPYRGVRLNAAGEELAVRIVRRHRVIESFLDRVLDVPAEDVHAEAERWEHAVSDAVVDRMDAILGRPAYDPHGSPIPDARGRLPRATVEPEETP